MISEDFKIIIHKILLHGLLIDQSGLCISFFCGRHHYRRMVITHLCIEVKTYALINTHALIIMLPLLRTCHLKTARRHMAGTSCRPFSKKGTRLGLMDTETINLLAWVGLRITLQEADVTQENVEGCATDIFSRFLGPMYWIDVYVADPTHFGWPVARNRQYLRMRHKTKILSEISPISNFAKRFWRAVEFSWSDMLCFHKPEFRDHTVIENELQVELDWAQNRANSRSHGQRRQVFGLDDEPFLNTLTDSEDLQWKAYKARWPGMAGQLNQDAMSSHAMHSNPKCLHTLIANCGIIVTDKVSPERWLLATECLLAQGFPILPGCFGDQRLGKGS